MLKNTIEIRNGYRLSSIQDCSRENPHSKVIEKKASNGRYRVVEEFYSDRDKECSKMWYELSYGKKGM